jgi:hypothetical protein
LYFQLPHLKKPLFSKRDFLQWKKVPASLSLFLKSEKIPFLLYLGKGPEYRPLGDLPPVPSAYWGLEHRSQITKGTVLKAILLY